MWRSYWVGTVSETELVHLFREVAQSASPESRVYLDSYQHTEMIHRDDLHPLTIFISLCHLVSFSPSFLQASTLSSISQSSLHPAHASSSSLIISFLWPLILPFLFYLHLSSINQASPCGLALRLHYAPPPPRSHIYFMAGRLERTRAPLANERVNFHMHYSHVEPPRGLSQLEMPRSSDAADALREQLNVQNNAQESAHYRDT